MANPVLNERSLSKAASSWAPPQRGTAYGEPGYQTAKGDTSINSGIGGAGYGMPSAPYTDGPVGTWQRAMTVNGTITATGTLFVLLLASAAIGWFRTGEPEWNPITESYSYGIPMLAWAGVGLGIVAAIALYFRPMWAKFLGPIYAIAQGFFVGAISRMYETFQDGIVIQAAGATIAVFAVMLVLYRTNIIKVTDRFRRIVMGATLGVAVFYGVALLIRLFAGADSVSFLHSPSLLGIGFSVLVAGLAAMNLAVDFDFIERGSKAGLAKDFEWFAAFGLLVTVVWLYLEILRLLSKLRER